MENGKCQCYPFYSGSSCETFEDCPDDLDEEVCETLKKTSLEGNIGVDLFQHGVGLLLIIGLIFYGN